MTHTDDELFSRGAATLVASWEEYTRGSAGAELVRPGGVAVAVFPSEPERGFFNNALLDRHLGPTERAAAVDAMEATYRAAGIDRYAAWIHESDRDMRAELRRRGYVLDQFTLAMGRSLDDVPVVPGGIELGTPDWAEYLRIIEVPGLFGEADPSAFHVLAARLDGEHVAAAMAFDHEGDCGVFNVTTAAGARRRGLGTALTARHLLDAGRRGCSTASLQSTEMAEGVYASVGFRDLGRFLEFVP
jgi:ribosomal protein S18 acetylase RimI-like enzyme